MTMVEISGHKWHLSEYYKANLDIVLDEAIPNKWDCFGIFHGREGSGKSTMAVQTCLYLDHAFTHERIVFSPKQFIEACDNCKPEQAILWDEAITGANIQQHAKKVSQTIISKLTQIRKKRLKIMICFPYLYMLNKYFVARSIFSVYVYAKSFSQRGHAFFYGSRKTEMVYGMMKERFKFDYLRAISYVWPDFKFMYSSHFCADVDEYEDKKDRSIAQAALDEAPDIWKDRAYYCLQYIKECTNGTMAAASKYAGLKPDVLQRFASRHNPDGQIST